MQLKQVISKVMTAIMLAAGLLAATAPAMPVSAASSTIDSTELGLDYGRYTGLGSTDVRITVAKIIRVAMGLLGIVAVVIVLIGGFTWMTAGGNEEKVAEAKKWIFAGIIGLAIILSAFAIASFVINQLVNATTSGDANVPFTSN